MGKYPKRESRESYLKSLLETMDLNPKAFMLAVTYRSPSETTIYNWINKLYTKEISLSKAKIQIERAERLYQCYRDIPGLHQPTEYRFVSAPQ